MGYKNLKECIDDLQARGDIIQIDEEVDPNLEMAQIQRRVYEAGGPAILYTSIKNCNFPAISNLFGTMERTRYIFRDTLKLMERLSDLKTDPTSILKRPLSYLKIPLAIKALPKKVPNAPVLQYETTIDKLPQIKSWPMDGGAYITLPQVYTENPERPGIFQSNIGMYRVQMSGGEYKQNEEVGLHYQIHRGIAVHHHKAIQRKKVLRVSIFVGGPPANTLAAVMPLPEGMSEVLFAGILGGRRFRYLRKNNSVLSAEADFCITGYIETDNIMPEGPFGDHLGYYSLTHNFPVMKVEKVYHRRGAIWPFTVVGRPPQEDSSFGKLIHEITGSVIPSEISGLCKINAVDEAGVHPLLFAIGHERYVPYQERKPQELLTIANAILGYGQLSLAKFLFIAATEDNPTLNIDNKEEFLHHMLERVDWRKDLHFHASSTIDTLDYTGDGLNSGSKLIIAAAGRKRNSLLNELTSKLKNSKSFPSGFTEPKVIMPGILSIKAPPYKTRGQHSVQKFCSFYKESTMFEGFTLIVLVDDSEFCAETIKNFLWVTFTRANPASDIDGIDSFVKNKHWGCSGPLVIDSRIKPHHAPPLIEDSKTTEKVNKLATKGKSLHGII